MQTSSKTLPTKNPEAVLLGSKGGKARAKKYTKEQLSAMGKKGGRPKICPTCRKWLKQGGSKQTTSCPVAHFY